MNNRFDIPGTDLLIEFYGRNGEIPKITLCRYGSSDRFPLTRMELNALMSVDPETILRDGGR